MLRWKTVRPASNVSPADKGGALALPSGKGAEVTARNPLSSIYRVIRGAPRSDRFTAKYPEVIGTLTMPDGRKIATMDEGAYQAALAASRRGKV